MPMDDASYGMDDDAAPSTAQEGEDKGMPDDQESSETLIPKNFFGKDCKVGDKESVIVTRILDDEYAIKPAGKSDDEESSEPMDSPQEETDEMMT